MVVLTTLEFKMILNIEIKGRPRGGKSFDFCILFINSKALDKFSILRGCSQTRKTRKM